MACLSINQKCIAITCGVKTHVVSLINSEIICFDHNTLRTNENNPDKSVLPVVYSVDSEDIGIGLMCSAFSSQGNLLAFCTYAKKLCVLDLTTEVCVKNVFQLARGASKVQFTPSSRNIIVADKSGDVYLFDLQKEGDVGKLILGHLSLLLDVLVTPEEQFIITSDRDEKIRVSSFPNAFNIVSYCLGHSEFVSSINLLPSNNNYLVSSSGDGTVRFWDYKVGKEILVCNTSHYLTTPGSQFDEQLYVAAITDSTALFLDSSTSLICVALEYLKTCLVLKCTSKNEKLQCTVTQRISLESANPWRLTFNSDFLWILLNVRDKVRVKAMKLNHTSHEFEHRLPEQVLKTLNVMNSQEMVTDFKKNIVDLLFKRKFDNVQEYLIKKEARLAVAEPSNKKIKS